MSVAAGRNKFAAGKCQLAADTEHETVGGTRALRQFAGFLRLLQRLSRHSHRLSTIQLPIADNRERIAAWVVAWPLAALPVISSMLRWSCRFEMRLMKALRGYSR